MTNDIYEYLCGVVLSALKYDSIECECWMLEPEWESDGNTIRIPFNVELYKGWTLPPYGRLDVSIRIVLNGSYYENRWNMVVECEGTTYPVDNVRDELCDEILENMFLSNSQPRRKQ
jgi:hypothetical protein